MIYNATTKLEVFQYIHTAIRDRLNATGRSQADLAASMGKSVGYIRQVCNWDPGVSCSLPALLNVYVATGGYAEIRIISHGVSIPFDLRHVEDYTTLILEKINKILITRQLSVAKAAILGKVKRGTIQKVKAYEIKTFEKAIDIYTNLGGLIEIETD